MSSVYGLNVPNDWEVVALDQIKSDEKKALISGPFGSNISAKYFTPTGVPVIRGNNLSLDVFTRFKENGFVFVSPEKADELGTWAQADDIIFTAVGTLGQIGLLSDNQDYPRYIISNKQIRLRLNQEKVTPQFVYYWLASDLMQEVIEQRNTGSSVPLINLGVVKNLLIPLPPLPEQKAIASVLSSVDDKIDLLHRQNKTLEAMAETLFRQWFIEEAREDWEDATFEKWISETKGGDWGKEIPIDDFTLEVQCIRGTDIADLQSGLPKSTPIRYVKAKKFESIKPYEGDIVLEISGGTETQSTGRAYYINGQVRRLFTKPLVFSNFCRLLKVRSPKFSKFVYLYLQYLYKSDEFFALENGSSGIKNLNYKVLLTEQFYKMPSTDLVESFDNEVDSFFSKVNANKQQIQTLENLRDTLLPKLMSGEVRVQYQTEEVA